MTRSTVVCLALAVGLAASGAVGAQSSPGAPSQQSRPAPGPVPPAPVLEFRELGEDTPVKMPSGATFTVSKGWHLARHDDLVVIEEPLRELSAAFVEVTAPTADEAVASAWKRWKPEFARPIRLTARPPAADGWDEIAQTFYETGADERRVVTATARRKGTTYYVTLVDGATAAAERRNAQLNTAIAGLKVPGREEENLAGRKARPFDADRIAKFLAFVEQSRALTKVPGVALAVVQDGRVVVEKGFGVLELGKPDPVTPASLFMIGSMTKPLTSLLMARLVDAGRFGWETPVTTLLPTFALGDPEATRKVTMAHTVCACTGLPRWDLEFIFEWNNSTAESRIELLRAMTPTTGFGETFQYSNLLVASGGYVAAMTAARTKDLRGAYRDAMRAEVLEPLGMTSTMLDLDEARKRAHARPHGRTIAFEPVPIPTDIERGVDSVMPAGGAWSNVRDISRWLLLEIGKGTLDGRRLVGEASLLERRKPRVRIAAKQSYGLALFVDESRGVQAIGHGGNTFGFTADATFYPEHGAGLVVLTNAASANAFTAAVRRRFIELLLDANEEAEAQLAFGVKQLAAQIGKRLEEISMSPDAAFVQPLLGAWTNPRLGTIEIRREGDGFALDAGEWKGSIGEHTDKSGARRIMVMTAPFAGFAFWPREHEGRTALLLETAQQKYWFERPPVTAR